MAGNRHGTIRGARWAAGRVGEALAFDGVDDYVALPANDPVWLPRYDFTVAFWVYFDRGDASKAMEVIFDLNCAKSSWPTNEHGAYIFRRSGKIGFQMIAMGRSREDLYTNTVFDEGKWYHVAAVRSGTRQQIYVNGELDNSRGCSSSPIDYTGAWDDDTVSLGSYSNPRLTIGNLIVWQRTYYLKGKLDEVALFYRALSAAEVRQLYEKQ